MSGSLGGVQRGDVELPVNFTRGMATIRGTGLSYLRGGAGEPVVLLHGWPQTSHAWDKIVVPLASAGYEVIAPDVRGTGHSERAESGYGKDSQAADLRSLLDGLGLSDAPIRLVGHDIGGMVAFSYARQWPAEVARLVLAELAVPGIGLERAMDVASGGRWHFGFFMTPEYPEMLIEGREDEFFRRWFADMSHRQEEFTPERLGPTIDAYRGRTSLATGFGHYRTLLDDGRINAAWADGGGRLTMPVLGVGGEHAQREALGKMLAGIAPDLQAVAIPDSGHFVAEENPSGFLEVILPFLAE